MAIRKTSAKGVWLTALFAIAGPARAVERPVFPLTVHSSGRYLVDRGGKPFRIHGDAPWDYLIRLSPAEADLYLANRAAKGFNALLVELIEPKRWAPRSLAPDTYDGIPPFQRPGDFATPNDAYFDRVADLVDRAAAHGMAVLLTPAYLGYAGRDEGWWPELNRPENTREVCRGFGKYLASGAGGSFRGLRDRTNIVWVEGGDFFPPPGAEATLRARAIMEGLRQGGATQLQTGHWSEEHISADQPDFAAAMEVNAVYTYGAGHDGKTYTQGRRAYAFARGVPPKALPAFLIETEYEVAAPWILPRSVQRYADAAYRFLLSAIGRKGAPTRPEKIRQCLYWGYLSSVGGAVFGNDQVWRFDRRWRRNLDAAGSLDMQHLGALLDSIPWYDLVPSHLAEFSNVYLVAGGADVAAGGDVAAAATRDGSALLAYVASSGTSARTVTVDLSVLRGPARARWFNPTSGAYVEIADALPARAQRFTTPGDNGTGSNDWVLVVRAGPSSP